MFHTNDPTRSRIFFALTLILTFCLAALPAFAIEPGEADPDPDEFVPPAGGINVLILADIADLDVNRLAPGRYIVRIVDDEGATRAVHEIVVRRR